MSTHTTRVGSATITALEIASAPRGAEELAALFGNVPRNEIDAAVRGAITWSFTLLLIRLGETTVLMDTGFGFDSGGPGRPTSALLEEAGTSAEEVDHVVITHCHGDHIGGLLRGDTPAFPNASLVVSQAEYDYWTKPGSDAAPEGARPIRDALAAYGGRVRTIAFNEEILRVGESSIRSFGIPGHTPGQIGLVVQSGDASLRALVDTLHAEFQLAHLDWSPHYDRDPEQAARSRAAVLDEVAETGELVHFYHLAYPGFGRVVRSGDAYAWKPEPR
ncbi:MAG: MBL fold metallo-hydrolase [Spirochaetota bacterium]